VDELKIPSKPEERITLLGLMIAVYTAVALATGANAAGP
jgi:hypothetical protein